MFRNDDFVVDSLIEKEVEIDEDFIHVYHYIRYYSGRFERYVTTKFNGGVKSFLKRNEKYLEIK